ncbi:uncharacterized protein LOC144923208 [Branchiostoma floridae x Branchiostoma belcheri]
MARNNNNVPPAAGQLRRSDRVKRKPDWFHRDPRYSFSPPPTLPTPPPPPATAPAAPPPPATRPAAPVLPPRPPAARQRLATPGAADLEIWGQPTLRSGGSRP